MTYLKKMEAVRRLAKKHPNLSTEDMIEILTLGGRIFQQGVGMPVEDLRMEIAKGKAESK